jgi:hypothetical protein
VERDYKRVAKGAEVPYSNIYGYFMDMVGARREGKDYYNS